MFKTGFSLIELMVVIAIVAVLAAVAVPAYQRYIRAAKISEATSVIAGFQKNVLQRFETSGKVPVSIDMLGLTASGGNPLESAFPATVNDYVSPYLAVIGIGAVQASPGSCAFVTTHSYISNLDSSGAFGPNSTPYIIYYRVSVNQNGVWTDYCSFNDVTAASGPDPDSTITDCVNVYNGSGPAADAFNATLNAAIASCT